MRKIRGFEVLNEHENNPSNWRALFPQQKCSHTMHARMKNLLGACQEQDNLGLIGGRPLVRGVNEGGRGAPGQTKICRTHATRIFRMRVY